MIWWRATLLVACLTLVGCGQQSAPPERDKVIDEKLAAERRILADPVLGPAEIRRRVHEAIKFESGLIVIPPGKFTQLFLGETFVVPQTSGWTIRCGFLHGLAIDFGSVVEGGSGGEDVSNSVEVHLADPPSARCEDLEVAVADELRSMTSTR